MVTAHCGWSSDHPCTVTKEMSGALSAHRQVSSFSQFQCITDKQQSVSWLLQILLEEPYPEYDPSQVFNSGKIFQCQQSLFPHVFWIKLMGSWWTTEV